MFGALKVKSPAHIIDYPVSCRSQLFLFPVVVLKEHGVAYPDSTTSRARQNLAVPVSKTLVLPLVSRKQLPITTEVTLTTKVLNHMLIVIQHLLSVIFLKPEFIANYKVVLKSKKWQLAKSDCNWMQQNTIPQEKIVFLICFNP